ncbi:TPA: hypothetical protein U1D18_000736 [Streptococcus suis]|nr:hypothetical protein [Streptococcus suis]
MIQETNGSIQKTATSEVVKLVKVSVLRGSGTPEDPGRIVEQYFDFNHELIYEIDPWREYLKLKNSLLFSSE